METTPETKGTDTVKKCDSNFPQCKRNAKVHFPASAFTAELNLCKKHAEAFTGQAATFEKAAR